MRVPPKLTAPRAARRPGRAASPTRSTRSRSRGPRCASRGSSSPRPGEERYRELKLLVDPPRRSRRRAPPRPAAAALASAPTRPGLRGARRRARPGASGSTASAAGSPAGEPRCRCAIARELVGRCRSLTRTIAELDRELAARAQQIAPALLALPGCGGVTAAKLLAEIGPIDRFQQRRPTRPPRRRRTTRSKLRQTPTPPPRPRRQPPTQLRAPPDRDHPSPHPPARTRLPRTQTSRRQKPTAKRSAASNDNSPAPSTHTLKNEPRLDIGATLAQVTDAFPRSSEPSAPSLSVCARSCLPIPRYGTPTWCFGRAVRTTSPRFATSTPNPTPGVGWDGR